MKAPFEAPADEVVDSLPLAEHGIDHLALLDRLVAAVRVDLVGRLAVQPVVGAAEAQAARA